MFVRRIRFVPFSGQRRGKFGKASSSVENQSEKITVKNLQRKYPINVELTRDISLRIYELLEISNLNISISIVSSAAMRKSYQEAFGISKTTDILSWAPEDYVHGSPSRDGPSIAPIIICPEYIHKTLLLDEEDYKHGELDLSEERGVSKTMATMFTVQERIPLLLIHGMLHLVGYDHESDEDWVKMTDREDAILETLKKSFPQGLTL